MDEGLLLKVSLATPSLQLYHFSGQRFNNRPPFWQLCENGKTRLIHLFRRQDKQSFVFTAAGAQAYKHDYEPSGEEDRPVVSLSDSIGAAHGTKRLRTETYWNREIAS